MENKKDKSALGCIVGILLILLSGLPIVMIDTSWWVEALLTVAIIAFRPAAIILWIWGLVCAITGEQSTLTVIYYISFVVIFIPLFFSVVRSLFEK